MKKAYTLTELLIVVMIIAVLSAVVLPKYNKVLETRKTTEAEDLMTAIRQEQEYRCAADRPYASNFSKLKSVAQGTDSTEYTTKNYTLSFASTGVGVEAKRNGKNYRLSIPSYADGRICCDDINNSGLCAELNRDYPTCTQLAAKADYKASPATCAAPGLPPPDEPECTANEYESCGPSCDIGRRLVRACVNGVFQDRSGEKCLNGQGQEIDENHECSCTYFNGPKKPSSEGCNSCGERQITWSCNTDNWQWVREEGQCLYKDGITPINSKDDCPCDKPCADGYLDNHCICHHCLAENNVQLVGDHCEPTITKEDCANDGGKVFVFHTPENLDIQNPVASCASCSAASRDHWGTSSDGTIEGCSGKDETQCPIENIFSYCKDQGQLTSYDGYDAESGHFLKKKCHCFTCEESGWGVYSPTSNGYLDGCQSDKECTLTKEDCKKTQQYLYTSPNGSCACLSCREGQKSDDGETCNACDD